MKSALEYRESLRELNPKVFLGGERVPSVADEPRLEPGINAVGITYDFALAEQHKTVMTCDGFDGKPTNRFFSMEFA